MTCPVPLPGGSWVQLTTTTAAAGTAAVPMMLTPGEYVVPASAAASFLPAVTRTPVTTTMTATIQSAWHYIEQRYGPQLVAAQGVVLRARPLTREELMGAL
jgi:hypothetical protein